MRTEWSDYKKPDATTDRGWLHIAWDDVPSFVTAGEHLQNYCRNETDESGPCCGNYLDYGPSASRTDGKYVHAVAYVPHVAIGGYSFQHIGESAWFATVDEAKQHIVETIRKHLDSSPQMSLALGY